MFQIVVRVDLFEAVHIVLATRQLDLFLTFSI